MPSRPQQLTTLGCALVVSCGLSGCATLPTLPPNDRVDVERVVDAVQCELFQAVNETRGSPIDLRQWHGEFVLTMKVEREAGGSGNVDFVVLSGTSILTPGLTAGLKTNATRQVTFEFDVPGNKVGPRHCERLQGLESGEGLHGDLGIRDWLHRAVTSLDKDEAAQATGFGHYVEFLVESQGEGKLRFIVLDASGGAGLGGKTSEKNTLNVAFARKPPPKIEDVVVVDKATGQTKVVRRPVSAGDAAARSQTRTTIQNQFLQNLELRQ